MVTEYIQAAMRAAHYEIMEDGRIFGTSPPCEGVRADGTTVEGCRGEVQSTLEDWILIKAHHGDVFPMVEAFDTNPQPAYAETDQAA